MSSTPDTQSDTNHVHGTEKRSGTVVEGTPHEIEFPEGGWKAWSVVLGAFLHQSVTLGYTNTHGVYNDFYVREYLTHYTSSQISWIGSVQLLFVVSTGLFAGRAFDTGYFYHLIAAGSLLFAFSLFMLSLTKPEQYYQILLAQGFGIGIASGITYVPSSAVIAHYFRRRRTVAMGVASAGCSIGACIHTIMLNQLFHGRAGFHLGVRASAGLCSGLLALAMLLMRTRLPPRSRRQGSTLQEIRTFFKEPAYLSAVLGIFFIFSALWFPIFFIQLKAIVNGLSPSVSFYTLVILNFANGVGRVIPNMFALPLGVLNVMIFCMTSLGIMIFCLLVVKDVPGTVIFSILYGFFSGSYAGVVAPMVASLAHNDGEIGARIGLCFAIVGIAGLMGTPISGALLTPSYIWWRPIVFAGSCVFIGCALLGFARYVQSIKKGTWRV